MKLDSKYFDSIRVSSRRGKSAAPEARASAQGCQWAGCNRRGLHRAPKGRAAEGEYYYFCREHVAEYNKAYNYFAGMDDNDLADYLKAATTGHRPTWTLGVNGTTPGAWDALRSASEQGRAQDPLDLLKAAGGRRRRPEGEATAEPRRRIIHKGALKHLHALNLDEHATAVEIRTQFKALVKLHHPDHNGGDRSSEERFREVIAAYNYLKQSGFC